MISTATDKIANFGYLCKIANFGEDCISQVKSAYRRDKRYENPSFLGGCNSIEAVEENLNAVSFVYEDFKPCVVCGGTSSFA